MKKPQKAFTLLEVILVGAVLALIAGVSIFSLVAFARAAMLEAATDAVVEFTTEARGNSIVMQDGRIWGIKVQAPPKGRPFVALFSCVTETCGPDFQEEVKRYTFPPAVTLAKPKPPSATLLIFAARTGELKDEGTRYIILNAGQQQRTAVVNEPGMIEVFPQESAKEIEVAVPGGGFPDVAIGQDGFPVFSHQLGNDLLVTKCNNADCTQHITTTSEGVRARETRIGILASGNPFLAFADLDASALGVIRCLNADCADQNPKRNPDPDWVAEQISLTINPDGLPIIVYEGLHRETNERALRFVRCLNATCTQTVTRQFASVGSGGGTSVVIGQNGFPLIAHNVDGLEVIACDDLNCDPNVGGPDPAYRPDPSFSFANHISMAMNQNGFPVIAYQPAVADVRVVTCAVSDCSETASGFTVLEDMESSDWRGLALAIGSDNLPGIAYSQKTVSSGNAPRFLNTAFAWGGGGGGGGEGGEGGAVSYTAAFAKCQNADCSGVVNVQRVGESRGSVAPLVSSAIPSGSNPVIGYSTQSAGEDLLGIVVCQNPFCS